MKKTRLSLITTGLLMCLSVLSCKKKHDNIYGHVTIHGTVTDDISGTPIPDATVQLITIERAYTGLVYVPEETGVALSTTTDSEGRYSISYEAKGVYELALDVFPTDASHVPSNVAKATDGEHIIKAGDHTQNLRCYRSAWAKIALINQVPPDSPTTVCFSVNDMPSKNAIMLNYFSGDTTVYLKLVGSRDYTNDINFRVGRQVDSTFKRIVSPGDTLIMQFFY